jgi:hypothetical protein
MAGWGGGGASSRDGEFRRRGCEGRPPPLSGCEGGPPRPRRGEVRGECLGGTARRRSPSQRLSGRWPGAMGPARPQGTTCGAGRNAYPMKAHILAAGRSRRAAAIRLRATAASRSGAPAPGQAGPVNPPQVTPSITSGQAGPVGAGRLMQPGEAAPRPTSCCSSTAQARLAVAAPCLHARAGPRAPGPCLGLACRTAGARDRRRPILAHLGHERCRFSSMTGTSLALARSGDSFATARGCRGLARRQGESRARRRWGGGLARRPPAPAKVLPTPWTSMRKATSAHIHIFAYLPCHTYPVYSASVLAEGAACAEQLKLRRRPSPAS